MSWTFRSSVAPWPMAPRLRTASSPRSFRLRFAHDTERPDQMAYNTAAVVVEVLMSRAWAAVQADETPINTRHGRSSDQRWRQRPAFRDHPPASAEHLRWFTPRGLSRSAPLSLEALTLELMAVLRLDVTTASLLARQSYALSQKDQDWLTRRAEAPIERRPLNDTEFRQLVRALERVHAVPVGQTDVLPNVATVEMAVTTLATWLNDYHPSPFVSPRLAGVFVQAHREHLDRRAAWAQRRLEMVSSRLAPSLHGQAADLAQTTGFQAALAHRKERTADCA